MASASAAKKLKLPMLNGIFDDAANVFSTGAFTGFCVSSFAIRLAEQAIYASML